MGRPDDYKVNDDTEKVDYAIHEHLESRKCMDGHQLPPLISTIVMSTKQAIGLLSELLIYIYKALRLSVSESVTLTILKISCVEIIM